MPDFTDTPADLPEPKTYEEAVRRRMLQQRLQQPQPTSEEWEAQHPRPLGLNLEEASQEDPQDFYAVHPNQAPQQLGINLPSAPDQGPNLRKAVELRGPPEPQLGLNISPGGQTEGPAAPGFQPPPVAGPEIPQVLKNDRAAVRKRLLTHPGK